MIVTIVGNGILGLMTAYRLIHRDRAVRATIIGPANQKGCASLAAAAMFNSFCEVDGGTLGNEIERKKWLFNKASNPYWPNLLKDIEEQSKTKINYGFGTFVVNNHASDTLEDENFDAIVAALKAFDEPYESVANSAIPNYHPSPKGRAARAIYIPREGWVNPVQLTDALKKSLADSGRVDFIDAYADRIESRAGRVSQIAMNDGGTMGGDVFFVAPGATFSKLLRNSNIDIKTPKVFYGIGCTVLLQTGAATLPNCVRTPNRGLACGIYAAPQDESHTIVGASNFISPEPEDHPRITSVYTLLRSAMEQINTDYYRAQLAKVNIGWRPTSEDTLPLLGATSLPNLLIATGTKRDGLHCSPVISDAMADLILTGRTKHDIELFRPERRAVRILSRKDAIATAVRHSINAAYQHGFEPAEGRMVEDLQSHYASELEKLHDRVGAIDWGIPVEMINMYKYGHIAG